jgi:hypothetical protein
LNRIQSALFAVIPPPKCPFGALDNPAQSS